MTIISLPFPPLHPPSGANFELLMNYMTRAKINTYVELGCELDLKLLEDSNYHYREKIKDIYLYGTYSYSKALKKTKHIHITNSTIRRKKQQSLYKNMEIIDVFYWLFC